MNSTSPEPQTTVKLTVLDRVPTAELSIFDASYGRVAQGVGELSADLPVGVYEVESVVGADRQRQFAILNRDAPAPHLYFEREEIEYSCAAPLAYTSTTREWHMGPAYAWSRQKTMEPLPGANCRLFIFVRTLQPVVHGETYDRNLRLLDRRGKTICDFGPAKTGQHGGVVRDPVNGWTALNVDVPAGFYQLHHGKRGKPGRYQPLWLSKDWETMVFIPGGEEPQLGEMALFMARQSEGFIPNDPAALAVETVLTGLRRGRNLADSQQMHILLKEKFENPWLGVLALHAMSLQPSSDRDLWGIVMANTRRMLGPHPDLMVLELKPGEPARHPFEYPPVLWASMKLLREHASQHPGTVAPNSLALRIFDALIADSDWVAWHSLPAQKNPAPIENAQQATFVSGGSKWVVPSFDAPGGLAGGATLADLFDNPDMPEENPLLADLIWLADTIPFDQDPAPVPYATNPRALLDSEDARRICKQLSLPVEKVQRALERMKNSPELLAQPRMMTITELAVSEEVLRRRSAYEKPAATRGGEAALVSLSASASALPQARAALARLKHELPERAAWADELSQRLEHFAAWLDSRQDACLLVDASSQVVFANAAFVALAGRPLKEMAAEWLDISSTPLLKQLSDLPSNLSQITVEPGGRVYTVQRLQFVDESSSAPVATIFRLRPSDQSPLSPEQLNDIRHRLYNVVLYASLAPYAGEKDKEKYLTRMDRDIAMLDQYTG